MPEEPRFRAGFGLRLLLLGRQWRQAVDAAISGDVFPGAGWRPLVYLRRASEPLRQKDLAALIGIEGPSLVHLLDGLEAAGLVERVEDHKDRRVRRLRLTPKGTEISDRIETRLAEVEQELLSEISDGELRAAAETLDRIGAALARYRAA